MSITQPTAPPLSAAAGNLDHMRGRQADTVEGEKARLRKATREFEAFFTHYLLKTMRKTVPDSPLSEGLPFQNGAGRQTFTDLFDMEVARHVSSSTKGGLADVLYRAMEPLIDAEFNQDRQAADIQQLHPATDNFVSLKRESLDLPGCERRQVVLGKPAATLRPIRTVRRTVPDSTISKRFGREIRDVARRHRLEPALIHSVIKAESAGDPNAVSPAGAKGLMQLLDSTAASVGVTDVFDPAQNIEGGAVYLKQLVQKYGDIDAALAAYNAGPGAVDRHGGIPPYPETEAYVKRVKRFLNEAKSELNAMSAKAVSHANR